MAELVLIYDSVTGGFISKQAGSTHIANNAIISALIASGAIGGAHLAAAAILSANIASGHIGSSHLGFAMAAGLLSGDHSTLVHTSGQIASGGVGSVHLNPALPVLTADVVDEFLGGNPTTFEIGELGWRFLNGGAISAPLPEDNHPGLYGHQTSTTQNTIAQLFLEGNTAARILASAPWDFTFIIRPMETTNLHFWVGPSANLGNGAPDATVARYGFEFLSGDGSWQTVCADGATQSRLATSSPFTSGWTKLRMLRTVSGVDFYLNDAFQNSILSSLPTSALGIGIMERNLGSLENRRYLIDFFRGTLNVQR